MNSSKPCDWCDVQGRCIRGQVFVALDSQGFHYRPCNCRCHWNKLIDYYENGSFYFGTEEVILKIKDSKLKTGKK